MSPEQLDVLHLRLCPYYCDGSRRGVGEFLLAIVADSGRSLEVVSYAWRTTYTTAAFHAAVYS